MIKVKIMLERSALNIDIVTNITMEPFLSIHLKNVLKKEGGNVKLNPIYLNEYLLQKIGQAY